MKDELNAPSALVTLKAKDRFQQILFACRIRKYNKRFKSSERALLISEAAIYKLDGKTFKPKNKTFLTKVANLIFTFSQFCMTFNTLDYHVSCRSRR